MGGQDQFDQVISALHQLALGDANWRRVVVALNDACGGDGTHIGIVPRNGNSGGLALSELYTLVGDANEIEREYMSDFFPSDERIPRLLRVPSGRIVPNEEMYTRVERNRTSATWNDFLCRLGTSNQLNIRMDGPEGSDILLALTRHVSSPDWEESDLGMIRSLLPHVSHAVRVRHTLAKAEALGASVAKQLDNPLLAVMLLDQEGKIIHASSRARQTLCERDGLSDRDGILAAHFARDNTKLGELLANAVPRFGKEANGGSISVGRPSCLPAYTLRTSPIVVPNGDLGGRRAVVVVWIVDPAAKISVSHEPIAELLGLTAAQSRVAAALAEGRTVREIATLQRVSEGTVRWHLKQIFARTGCSSQSDLVRLVLSITQIR